MLPRSRHKARSSGPIAENRSRICSIQQLWQRDGVGVWRHRPRLRALRWLLPEISTAADRQAVAIDHQRKSLDRARQFAAALDRPGQTPSGLDLILVAGDAVDTPSVIAVERSTGRLRVLEMGPGDGSVLRSSALMDERVGGEWQPTLQSPIGWTDTLMLFTNHLGLTKDRIFSDNVLYWLLEDPRNS